MRAAFRTVVTLTALPWGFYFWGGLSRGFSFLSILAFCSPAFSAEYYWSISGLSGSYSSPSSACSAFASQFTVYKSPFAEYVSDVRFYCKGMGGYDGKTLYQFAEAYRQGTECPEGQVYDSQTGICTSPPEDCPTSDIFAAVSCTYIKGAGWVCPGEVCRNSCAYVTSPAKNSHCDSATSICAGRYSGTGAACSAGSEPCTDASCADAPAANEPPPAELPCATYEGTTVCIADDNTGCGTVNGVEGCFTPDKNCGSYNGTFTCFPQDKPNNNCGYANGEKVCFDPDNPTQKIPPTSADHPVNGGNADGNDNNDPMNPADMSGTSPQGSNQGATNESVDGLGEKLGDKIDKTNSLLDGIDGLLDDIKKGLFGVEYNPSAEWSDGQASAAGAAVGDVMGQSLSAAVEEAISARDEQVGESLNMVPGTVDGFLGSDGELVPALNSLGDFLPEATGCADYVVPVNAMGVSISVSLPVCFLSRFKSLIEWVFWCLTVIGLWNIFYSGLRLDNAKASRDGH